MTRNDGLAKRGRWTRAMTGRSARSVGRLTGAGLVFAAVLCVASPSFAQLDIGTIIYHESYDDESAFPTTPEVNTLGLDGLVEVLDGAPGFPGGIDLTPPDRGQVHIESVDPATGINDVYTRSALPSFGPGDVYGLRAEFDGWRVTEGGGGLTDAGTFATGPIFGDYLGTYDPDVHTFVNALLAEHVGIEDPDNAFPFPLGVNFIVLFSSADDPLILDAAPILDTSVLELPFTIDMVVDRTVPSVEAQIRFFDGADVAFSTTAGLSGPAFPIVDSDNLRVFGQNAVLANTGPGDMMDVDFVDLKVGRGSVAPEPTIAALLALGLFALSQRRQRGA